MNGSGFQPDHGYLPDRVNRGWKPLPPSQSLKLPPLNFFRFQNSFIFDQTDRAGYQRQRLSRKLSLTSNEFAFSGTTWERGNDRIHNPEALNPEPLNPEALTPETFIFLFRAFVS
jgi:hypothetical protein